MLVQHAPKDANRAGKKNSFAVCLRVVSSTISKLRFYRCEPESFAIIIWKSWLAGSGMFGYCCDPSGPLYGWSCTPPFLLPPNRSFKTLGVGGGGLCWRWCCGGAGVPPPSKLPSRAWPLIGGCWCCCCCGGGGERESKFCIKLFAFAVVVVGGELPAEDDNELCEEFLLAIAAWAPGIVFKKLGNGTTSGSGEFVKLAPAYLGSLSSRLLFLFLLLFPLLLLFPFAVVSNGAELESFAAAAACPPVGTCGAHTWCALSLGSTPTNKGVLLLLPSTWWLCASKSKGTKSLPAPGKGSADTHFCSSDALIKASTMISPSPRKLISFCVYLLYVLLL